MIVHIANMLPEDVDTDTVSQPPHKVRAGELFPVHTLHSQFGLQRVLMRPGLERIKSGDLAWLQEETDMKLKSNVLTAYFLEEIWKAHKALIKQRLGTHALDPARVPSMEWLRGEVDRRKYIGGDGVIDEFLKRESQIAFQQSLDGWIAVREERQKQPDAFELPDKLYAAFRSAISARAFDMQKFMIRGMNTANTTTWNCIQVIPSVYHRQFGRDATAEEYEDISRRNVALISDLANTHIDIFSNVRGEFTGCSIPEARRICIISSMFRLVVHGGKFFLSLQPDAFNNLSKPEENNAVTGCPALVSFGENKGIILELNDWIMSIARDAGVFNHASYLRA